MAIRDTSAQDNIRSTREVGQDKRRRTLLLAGVGVALLLAIGWVASGWLSGTRSVSAERVPEALAVIADRARHLESFIRDYARFARLPAPRREPQQWRGFLQGLRSQMDFGWDGEHADAHASFDPAQVQQALLNLLKNAHEAGGDDAQVQLRLRRLPTGWRIDVMDLGSGMNEAVIAQALLPFYSTKRDGTGLGLALVREIAEAHGGHVSLANREGGGLSVAMVLPDAAADM